MTSTLLDRGSLGMLGIPNAGVGVDFGGIGAVANPLAGAVAAWRASTYSGSGHLKDLTGNRHHLRQGSTWSAQILDGALELPGVIGNIAFTAHSAAASIVGDLQLDADVYHDTWRPAASGVIAAKRNGPGGEYVLRLNTAGTLEFFWYEAGVLRLSTSTAAVTAGPEPGRRRLRVTRTFAGVTATIKFFTSLDAVSFTQLGADVVVATGGATATATTQPVAIGTDSAGSQALGCRVFSVAFRNGVGGPVVARFDATTQADGAVSWVAATGETWTVQRSSGADTNDPLFLPYAGEKYLALPGIAGNYASTPSTPATQVTGDMQLDADVHPDSWRPGLSATLIAKRSGSTGEYCFRIFGGGSGVLHLFWYEGATIRIATSTVAPPADAGRLRLRATRAFSGSIATVKFFTSTDGVAYTQLGANVVLTAGPPTPTALPLAVAADEPATMRVYSAAVRSGVDGPVVARFDASRSVEPHTTVSSATGETWTITRAATGRKAALVDRALFLFGTDDYMETPDAPLLNMGADPFTVMVVFRSQGIPSSVQALIAKRLGVFTGSQVDAGWALRHSVGGDLLGVMGDGVTASGSGTSVGSHTVGKIGMLSLRRKSSTEATTRYQGSAATSLAIPTGSFDNNLPVMVGARSGGNYADMEFMAAAIFRRALSDAELAAVARAWGVG